jgi:hypothetical protein
LVLAQSFWVASSTCHHHHLKKGEVICHSVEIIY